MTGLIKGISTLAIVAALAVAPTVSFADKGGAPNANGLANGKGSANAHKNKPDPNPTRGNDSAPAEPDDPVEKDYEGVGVDTFDGEEEEEYFQEY
ncbi:hypothetical protein [Marinovum sp.]|uniref:hypothetical protein n=1 Tax=Marinovum sp. TaxID=2024839 RepID=UPI003A932AE4